MYSTDADKVEEKRDLNLSKENSFRNTALEKEKILKNQDDSAKGLNNRRKGLTKAFIINTFCICILGFYEYTWRHTKFIKFFFFCMFQ